MAITWKVSRLEFNINSRITNMAASDVPRDPTEEEAIALFKAVEEKFPSKTLGNDKCYIATVRYTLFIYSHCKANTASSLQQWLEEASQGSRQHCIRSSSSGLNTPLRSNDKP